jgi:hypothetical protein
MYKVHNTLVYTGEWSMDNDINKEKVSGDSTVIFSPSWNEFYVDGAFITVDDFAVRLAFINHIPKSIHEGTQAVSISRKVDVVMSEKAFIGLVNVMNQLKEKMTTQENKG